MTEIIKKRISQMINILALLTLIIAYIGSWVLPEEDLLPFAKQVLPEAQSFYKVVSYPLTYKGYVHNPDGQEQTIGYVVIEEADGYGGPVKMATGIGIGGRIISTAIVKHMDTPSFIEIILDREYLNQFTGKSIADPLCIGKDIDSVSGATYSSRGAARAISLGSHTVARKYFGLDVMEESIPLKFGLKEISVLFLVLLMLIGVILKIRKLRWVTLIGALVFIGFKFNTPISLANVAALLMGNFPLIQENFVWYVFLIGIPVVTILFGRNLYCFWLCPFGALQEVLGNVGGGDYKCYHKKIETWAAKIRYLLVYVALMGAILLKSPGFAGFESFGTLFGLQEFSIQWFILPVVLFAALFINRFWCRFFCPGMVINGWIIQFRILGLRLVRKKFKPGSQEAQVNQAAVSDEVM